MREKLEIVVPEMGGTFKSRTRSVELLGKPSISMDHSSTFVWVPSRLAMRRKKMGRLCLSFDMGVKVKRWCGWLDGINADIQVWVMDG
jgi:hypothetical protein